MKGADNDLHHDSKHDAGPEGQTTVLRKPCGHSAEDQRVREAAPGVVDARDPEVGQAHGIDELHVRDPEELHQEEAQRADVQAEDIKAGSGQPGQGRAGFAERCGVRGRLDHLEH